MARYLDPKSDLTFKKIFGNHPDLLKSFLNAVLPLPEDCLIETLSYLSPENVPRTPIAKYSIVDVRCCDNHKRGRFRYFANLVPEALFSLLTWHHFVILSE